MSQNQNSNIEKINQVVYFANHITERLSEQTKIFNKNLETTSKLLQKIKYTSGIRLLIQNELYQADQMLSYLQMLERTISLSMYEIPNLEIISKNEL